MKSKIVKALVAFLFVMLSACTVCFMSACSCGGNNNKVTVTFVTNGGKEIAPVTLEKGEEFTLPEAEKEGLVFADWYYDEDFGSVCPRTITAKKDEMLYARYGAVLTFDTAGGSEIEQRTYFEGEELGALPVSYKDGFSFGGWYYDAEHDKIVGKKDSISRSLTVYAGFSVATDTIRKITSVRHVSDSPVIEATASGVILHNGNIDEYISFASASGEETGLICRQDGDGFYVLEPSRKLAEGMTYTLKARSSAVKFLTVDGKDAKNADEVTVTTSKEKKRSHRRKTNRPHNFGGPCKMGRKSLRLYGFGA